MWPKVCAGVGPSHEGEATASEVICPLQGSRIPATVLLFHRKELTTLLEWM